MDLKGLAWSSAAALAAASLPALLLWDAATELLPGRHVVFALLVGLAMGWWSRPRWAAIAALALGIAPWIVGLWLTAEPCRSDFCEGFSPQAGVTLVGIALVWPALLLGTGLAMVARLLRDEVRAGGWKKALEGLAGVWLLVLGALLVAVLVVGRLQ